MNAGEIAEQQSVKTALIEALKSLSFDHREAILLCYFEELSVQEIAEVAGCQLPSCYVLVGVESS